MNTLRLLYSGYQRGKSTVGRELSLGLADTNHYT